MKSFSLMPDAGDQTLIFDGDGTLADTLPIHYQAWADAVAYFGGILPAD